MQIIFLYKRKTLSINMTSPQLVNAYILSYCVPSIRYTLWRTQASRDLYLIEKTRVHTFFLEIKHTVNDKVHVKKPKIKDAT